MNLKGFKKVHDDNHKAILKNEKGHTITLAKNGLSPGHLDGICKLPLHKAEGGGVGVEDALDNNDAALRVLQPQEEPEPQQPPQQPIPAQPAPAQPQAAAQPDGLQMPNTAGGPEGIPYKSAEGPATQQPVSAQQPQETVATKHEKQMNHQAGLYEQDLMNGHITPKTYGDLINDKSVIGKIGTLFGLLVSGAGSGLSHQPNMALQMMDKEIDRDLEAQKATKENTKNLYQLNIQHELNQAGITKTQAEAAGVWMDVKAKALNNSKSQLQLNMLNELQGSTDKTAPNTPQRQQAQGLLNTMRPIVHQEIMKRNKQTALQLEDSFKRKQQLLRMSGMEGGESIARSNEERHVPGTGDAAIPVPGNVRQELTSHQKLQDAAKDLLSYSKGHTNIIPNTPGYNTAKIKAETLQQMIREGMLGTVFRESEKPLLKKFVDENPTGVFKMLSTQPKLREILASNRMQGNALKTSYGLPAESGSAASHKDGDTGNYNGKPVVYKNGKWAYR